MGKDKPKKLVELVTLQDKETGKNHLYLVINGKQEIVLDQEIASFYPKMVKYGCSKNTESIESLTEDRKRAISSIAPENANAYLSGETCFLRDLTEREIIFTIEAINYFHINEEQAKRCLGSLG